MELGLIFKSLFALCFVLALIYITSFILQKVNFGVSTKNANEKKKITLKEVKIIDAKNKLILTEYEGEETLTLISAYGNIVLKEGKNLNNNLKE